jgi:valyl-tRNA synthetase
MDKTFDPQKHEEALYKRWESSGSFTPEIDPSKKPFVIMMPLPNVTGALHIGHALMLTLQDILIRYQRMRGRPTLYLPGKDHAAIAAQNVIEKKLWEEEERTRHDLGKKEFLKRMWEWMDTYGNLIEDQVRKIGTSCDWSRKRFTMDEKYQRSVEEAFKRLRRKGLIYQGEALVNWCPRCGTTLSNLEVEHEERRAKLWFIDYPSSKKGERGITVATTRPETMLGDVAVAVSPKDKRYQKMVGKKVLLPLLGRELPVIVDETVDSQFGTGAVKITPAHDPNDFAIARHHQLPLVKVIDTSDKITKEGGPYEGLGKEEAREKVLADLSEKGCLHKIDEGYSHSVGVCYRCRTAIEPLVLEQWFVKATVLAKPAIEAVKKGEVKIIPKRFEKVYLHWMENIHDWCISRQIWWGHPVPAKGSQDTLDTWFSSALWPFATLGWPKKTADLDYFYPGTVMETGWDILFFWVARMMMMGIELMGDIPFSTIVLHGMVKDKTGKKMSKSRPDYNIDPLDMIGKYGADPLRMALVVGVSLGQDQTLAEEKVLGYRNFANKVWNIGRFTRLALEGGETFSPEKKSLALEEEDRALLKKKDQLVKRVSRDLGSYRFSQAGEAIYQFVWHELADIYIEKIKDRLREGDGAAQATLLEAVGDSLKLLHPFMPFVTEAVWQELRGVGEVAEGEELLITSSWPDGNR